MTDIYRVLDEHAIGYDRVDHPAVFTVEESRRLVPELISKSDLERFLEVTGHRPEVMDVPGKK